MASAPYTYLLQIEVDPEKGQPYLYWLQKKHIADVMTAPGFLWARKTMVDEKAKDGWLILNVIYGLRSREDFEAYKKSDLFKSFAEEFKPFEGTFRITRFFGRCDLELG